MDIAKAMWNPDTESILKVKNEIKDCFEMSDEEGDADKCVHKKNSTGLFVSCSLADFQLCSGWLQTVQI